MSLTAQLGTLSASIPSPSQGVWHAGGIPLRAYAFAILAGIVVAIVVTRRRWVARGGHADDVLDIALWAVPFGIVGGRLYHVITTPEPYWGKGGNPAKALYIWDGGLGIWGAIALGAVGAYIGCRRLKVSYPAFADALAPGLLFAQAIGRLGNYFNQELFGSPTDLPWALRIDSAHLPIDPSTGLPFAEGTTFHPTFLYELLWNVAGAFLLIWLDRRFRLGHGQVFWLYVLIYTTGRVWIEALRIDTAEHILGLRLNIWTSILVWVGALIAFIVVRRRHPGREETVQLAATEPEQTEATDPTGSPAS
ncbi:prolipoprotein diacylglyceryl transferase [Luteimicrobium subarcticum]|uniref:Phosphatidylglycerol--prolipoprotein diacylglyceryl transferase n=1 Tax=Luteimicrobium subarcticum TaxID=620910 RepID=A0A2M8W3H6_9MICO|nr:prolipoprotein diacylglyceryl transferase [Luteimicrobium subarcticum]PJI85467.1 prolipoprotein diacylglyceryl transferase [Luteimicrobium subarcticum]